MREVREGVFELGEYVRVLDEFVEKIVVGGCIAQKGVAVDEGEG